MGVPARLLSQKVTLRTDIRYNICEMQEEQLTFFKNPILNSPYDYPSQHWETDAGNQPTGRIAEKRRPSSLRSPIPVPKAERLRDKQMDLFVETVVGVDYRDNDFINMVRAYVDEWRAIAYDHAVDSFRRENANQGE